MGIVGSGVGDIRRSNDQDPKGSFMTPNCNATPKDQILHPSLGQNRCDSITNCLRLANSPFSQGHSSNVGRHTVQIPSCSVYHGMGATGGFPVAFLISLPQRGGDCLLWGGRRGDSGHHGPAMLESGVVKPLRRDQSVLGSDDPARNTSHGQSITRNRWGIPWS